MSNTVRADHQVPIFTNFGGAPVSSGGSFVKMMRHRGAY